jgi:hypothetical protein
MRQLRANDWEYIVAGVNLILAFVALAGLKRTGADAFGMAAVWCSATSVFVLIRILRRVINERQR